MNSRLCQTLVLLLALCSAAEGRDCNELEDNTELAKIFALDQADRKTGDEIDREIVSKRDKERQNQTLRLLKQGLVRTSNDYLHAAYVFQHGESVDDSRLALSLAWVSASINPKNDRAKWLTAAAWDRLMMKQSKPQWYGTQFRRRHGESEWRLYKMQQDAVTDAQRKALNVPSLEEAKRRVRKMNKTR